MITKRYAGVLFDLDGVIIDSSEVMRVAFNYAYSQFFPNKKAPFNEFVKHMGMGFRTIMNKMNLPLDMYDYFSKKSIELTPKINVFEGITEILAHLKQNNVYVGLATGKDRYRTHLILKQNKLLPYFDKVVCSDDVKRSKPYPDSIDLHIECSRLEKKQLIFIGDSISDIQCAHNSNISSVAVLWGQGRRQELFHERPDYFAYDVANLNHIFCEIKLLTE